LKAILDDSDATIALTTSSVLNNLDRVLADLPECGAELALHGGHLEAEAERGAAGPRRRHLAMLQARRDRPARRAGDLTAT
jgi:hypothetical protein